MNNGNLIVLSPALAREYGRKGGLAKAKNMRMQKTFKEMAKAILALPLNAKEIKILLKAGVKTTDLPETKKGLLLFSVTQKAISKGDSQSLMRLAELTGEHIDEKKITLDGDTGQRTTINLIPKGGIRKVEIEVGIKAVYKKGGAFGTDED